MEGEIVMILQIEIKESDSKRIKDTAFRLAINILKIGGMDVECCGLINDLLRGCGLTQSDFDRLHQDHFMNTI
jgi:hypothetical protein